MTELPRTKILDMPLEERPRERLTSLGPKELQTKELLAILLGSGRRDASALDVADEVLEALPYLLRTRDVRVQEVMGHPGIGEAKAARIVAALELGWRMRTEMPEPGDLANEPQMVADLFSDEFCHKMKEEFWVLMLDVKCRAFARHRVSEGTLNQALVHPREVFQMPVRLSARGIILVHNHPSGDPSPSTEDRQITRRLAEVGALMGIEVLDHVIVAARGYYSFKQEGAL